MISDLTVREREEEKQVAVAVAVALRHILTHLGVKAALEDLEFQIHRMRQDGASKLWFVLFIANHRALYSVVNCVLLRENKFTNNWEESSLAMKLR